MTNVESLHKYYQETVKVKTLDAEWILDVRRDKACLKERKELPGSRGAREAFVERGSMYGSSLKRSLPVIRSILSTVQNELGIGMDLHHFLNEDFLFQGKLPLHSEGGYKLALLFKLQERVQDMDRIELMARRIHSFTAEEAGYWWSRLSDFDEIRNRWAQNGMRIMLGGTSEDKSGVAETLQRLRLERLEV